MWQPGTRTGCKDWRRKNKGLIYLSERDLWYCTFNLWHCHPFNRYRGMKEWCFSAHILTSFYVKQSQDRPSWQGFLISMFAINVVVILGADLDTLFYYYPPIPARVLPSMSVSMHAQHSSNSEFYRKQVSAISQPSLKIIWIWIHIRILDFFLKIFHHWEDFKCFGL